MDDDDLELFERSLRAATERHTGADLDVALAELGWAEALAGEPRAAVSLLFGLQGAATATSSAIDRVMLDGLGLDAEAIVLPMLDTTLPPGVLAEGRISVTGIGTAALAAADRAVVVARIDGADVAATVAVAELELREIRGVDPWSGLVEVSGAATVDAAPTPVPSRKAAIARAQVAIGHELVGVSRTMLAQAREHALEREQFGQPIAMFQAVRHRLAETLVAIEMAEAVLDAAWLDGSPETAAMAKALAGRGARTAARHCQQVLAGIGFTTEHPLHRSIRRTLVLDELFGSARTLTRALGDDLLATRELPPLLPL